MPESPELLRVRREPPPFRRIVVRDTERLSPRLVRITFTGPDLEGFVVPDPAASVRLLLPAPGESDPVIPTWDRNQFVLRDGQRPIIRTLTPRRVDTVAGELDVWIVIHDGGAASRFAATAAPGGAAAVSGPARGYQVDDGAGAHLLAGDETALAAISQLLEVLPSDVPVHVHVEVAHADARVPLPQHRLASVDWHVQSPDAPPGDVLVAAVRNAVLDPGTRVWAAGEAAAMQRIRRHLFEDRQLPRSTAVVRGYWKHGRAGDAAPDT